MTNNNKISNDEKKKNDKRSKGNAIIKNTNNNMTNKQG